MGDLISRSALIKAIKKWIPHDKCGEESLEEAIAANMAVSMLMEIEEAPTAYDKEKVVEQLDDYLFEKYCIEGENEVEKIVKAGGVNE